MVRAGPSDDHVVHEFDPQDLAGAHQLPGRLDVSLAGLRAARGVVVRDHDRRRRSHDGRPVHFAGLDEDAVEGADTDQMEPRGPAAVLRWMAQQHSASGLYHDAVTTLATQ